MRKIDKQKPPNSFTTYKQKTNPDDSTYVPLFEDMEKNVKNDLRESLLTEQGWVCGYCQQKISDVRKCKIEHHCEQHICNGSSGTQDKRLDYTNLMAVCTGESGKAEKHCDTNKAKFDITNGLPIEISPWSTPHMNSISYHSSGLIKSSNQRHDYEINDILNLNLERLKTLRKKKFILFMKYAGNLEVRKGKDKLKKLLTYDLVVGNSKFSNSFPGMSEFMLRKFCN